MSSSSKNQLRNVLGSNTLNQSNTGSEPIGSGYGGLSSSESGEFCPAEEDSDLNTFQENSDDNVDSLGGLYLDSITDCDGDLQSLLIECGRQGSQFIRKRIYFVLMKSFGMGSKIAPDILLSAVRAILPIGSDALHRKHPVTLRSLLHYICEYNEIEVVCAVLDECEVNVNIVDGTLCSLLCMVAMTHRNAAIAMKLLERGADPRQRNNVGCHAVDYAAMYCDKKLVDLLLDATGIVDNSTVECACAYSEEEITNIDYGDARYDLIRALFCRRYAINDVNENGDTVQLVFCRKGLRRLVFLALEFGADPRIENAVGETALSVSEGRDWWDRLNECASQSSSQGTDIAQNSCIEDLFYSCRYNFVDRVKILVQKTPNINLKVAVTSGGQNCKDSCLRVACEGGFLEIVEVLLKNNADPNQLVCDTTCMLTAIQSGHFEVVNLLIRYAANVNLGDNLGGLPIHAAILKNDIRIVDLLLESGANVNGTDASDTPLLLACMAGNVEMVKLLLKYVPPHHCRFLKRINIDAFIRGHWSPIAAAAFKGHFSIVKLLVAAGAFLNMAEQKCTALSAACRIGHEEMTRYLLEHGADPNVLDEFQNSSVHSAAMVNSSEILRLLQEHSAQMDPANIDGVTPLYMACEKGHIDSLTVLITLGADPNAKDLKSVTPLHVAAQSGHLPVVRKLLESGAHPNHQTECELTALYLAAQNGHVACCDLLIDFGAIVDLQSDQQQTPLHVAANNGHVDVVRLLIARGSDVNATDCYQYSPITWALRENRAEIVRLLVQAGAEMKVPKATPMVDALHRLKRKNHELSEEADPVTTRLCRCNRFPSNVLFEPCKCVAMCADCFFHGSNILMCPECECRFSKAVVLSTGRGK